MELVFATNADVVKVRHERETFRGWQDDEQRYWHDFPSQGTPKKSDFEKCFFSATGPAITAFET
jgi:hypothetical protein